MLIYARLQLTGLNSIIPEDLLSVFDENELEVSSYIRIHTTEKEKIGLQRNEGRELVLNPISLLKINRFRSIMFLIMAGTTRSIV